MLRLAAIGWRFRAAVVILTAVAVVVSVIISHGIAAAGHGHGSGFHHGHYHHGHDHDHDDEGTNGMDSHEEAVPPHVHFVSFLPRIDSLPWMPGRPVVRPTEPPEILQAYFSLFERPPKPLVL